MCILNCTYVCNTRPHDMPLSTWIGDRQGRGRVPGKRSRSHYRARRQSTTGGAIDVADAIAAVALQAPIPITNRFSGKPPSVQPDQEPP